MLGVQTGRFGSVPESMPFLRALDAQVVTYSDSGTDPAHLVTIGRAQAGITFDTYCEEEQRLGAELVTVYPSDGTGFEVGAVSLPKRAEERRQAEDFLAWVVSDEGQALASSIAGQVPISRRLPDNLSQRLTALDIAVYGADPQVESLKRSLEIGAWQAQVYAPRGCTPDEITNSPEPACGSVPARDAKLTRIVLGPSIARTGLLSLAAGGIAVLLGSFIALALRFAPRRSLIFIPLILLPGLVPPAVSAETLMLLGAPAYSIWTLLGAVALNATPFAALIMVFGLSSVSREELLAAKDLGARGARIARRILAPALVSTVFPSFAVSSLMAASDVSASTVNAGPEPYLAPLARHALNASSDHSLALKILALYLAASAITALSLARALRLKRASTSPFAPSSHAPELFGRASRALGAALVLAGLAALGLIAIVIYRLVVAFLSGSPQTLLFNAARESFLVLLLGVPIAALIGFITALSNLRRMKALNTVALLGLLASPAAGGILVHIIHRRPLEFHGHVLLPPLVGGGSPAGGLIAVLIAYLLLALPAAPSSWFSRFQAPVMCVVPPRIRERAERAPSFTSSSQ